MKIAYISPFFYPVLGGMEKHIYEIARRISKEHDVWVYTSNIDRKGRKLKEIEKIDNINIKRFEVYFKLGDFASFFPGIFKELNVNEFDIIHVHGYRHPHNFATFFTNTFSIITPHFPVYPKTGLKRKILISFFDFLVGDKIFKKYTKIIALTWGEKRWLVDKFRIDESKIEIIPNGIPEYYLKKHNGKIFRNRYNLGEKFMILSVGRIHFSKGFQDLIQAFSLLPKKIRENSVIVIIGPDGGYLDKLKELVRKLGLDEKVIFTGKVSEEEKLNAYEACDLFVLPSYWEGFGIVLLEAMAKNKIVMARKSGGQMWVVPESKFLFNSINELAEKIKLVYDGKLERRKNYKKIVKKYYTWNTVARKHSKLYESVLNGE